VTCFKLFFILISYFKKKITKIKARYVNIYIMRVCVCYVFEQLTALSWSVWFFWEIVNVRVMHSDVLLLVWLGLFLGVV
jgi:hypothetical protein